jgi:predicted alpha/beta hydrolase family esterase
MPNPETPKKAEWVEHLQKIVPDPNSDTFFVGHSMGCQAIQRYLEKLSDDQMVGGVVFVALDTLSHMGRQDRRRTGCGE